MITLASNQTGQPVQFWGRYFENSGNLSPDQYQPAAEAPLLNQRGIRVLPIGRQTNHVDIDEATGKVDGATNANAIIDAFGVPTLTAMPSGLFVFGDVERPPHESLVAPYYRGWSAGLVQTAAVQRVTLLPGVCGAEGDSDTWTQLAKAVANGATCAGTWIARPGTMVCHPLHPFDEHHVRPPGLPSAIKVLVWQCVQECNNLDFNMLNPAFESNTLAKMVLPAAVAPTV